MSETLGVEVAGRSGAADVEPEPTVVPTAARARRLPALSVKPLVGGLLLALLGMNLSTVRPTPGIDSSFRVGLTEAVLERMQFGVDIVWPYGPLGFLGGPTLISRGLLAVAILYQFVALTVLFTTLVFHLGRLGLGRVWSVVALAPLALAISLTDNIVPEVVSVTLVLVLVVLWQAQPGLPSPTEWWVLTTAGVVAGAQVLVKFGPGMMACAVVAVFAVSTDQRLRRLAIAAAAMTAGFLVCWLLTGQDLAALPDYFRTSFELSSGYQDAQAFGPDTLRDTATGALMLVIAGVGLLGSYRWIRTDRRAWWPVVTLVLAAWFVIKQGIVRWDPWHIVGALLMVELIVLGIRWQRRLLVLPLGAVVLTSLVAFTADPPRLRSTWSDRTDAAMVVLSSRRWSDETAAARERVRAGYDVPAPVIEALEGGTVHAEEWDVNALWANELEWSPLPVFQSYSTYTAALDRINAERYAALDGPDGVLLEPTTVDDRYGLWESPDARVALTCNFVPIVSMDDWTALRRAPNACGPARELGTERVASGESVDVPEPTSEDALVVAHFELPGDPIGRLVAAVARPLRFPQVTVDATRYRLVSDTAGGAHIVRSPGRIGDRDLPHGPVDHSTLSFANTGPGDVVVRFEEIALNSP